MAFLIPLGIALIGGSIKGIGKISQAVNHGKTRAHHEEDGPAIVDEQGFLGGWLSKRAVEKTTSGRSGFTRNYSWKPRYFRQTETGDITYSVDKDPATPPKGVIRRHEVVMIGINRREDDRFYLGLHCDERDPNMIHKLHVRTPHKDLTDIWICNLILRLDVFKNSTELINDCKAFLAADEATIKHGFAWSKYVDHNNCIGAKTDQDDEEEHFAEDDDYGGGSSSSTTPSSSGGGGGSTRGGGGGGGDNGAAMKQYQQKLKEWEATTRERCFSCKGQGSHTCTQCKGSKKNSSGKPCSSCSGKGQFNCLKCTSHKGLNYGPKSKFPKPQPPK